jgi:hypothetical protein
VGDNALSSGGIVLYIMPGPLPFTPFQIYYEGVTVNILQMHIKRKTCDTGTWQKHLCLDISSTNTDTLVPSLYQRVEFRSMEVLSTVVSATSAFGRASSATFERP